MSQPSDTPESDANSTVTPAQEKDGFRGYVSTDFARNLERQRDAARKDARLLAQSMEGILGTLDAYRRCKAFQDGMALKGWEHKAKSALAAHEVLTAKN